MNFIDERNTHAKKNNEMKNKCEETAAVKGKCPAGTFPFSATFPSAFPLAACVRAYMARFLMKYFHLWKSDRDLDRGGVLFRFAAVYGLKDALKIQDVRTVRLRNGSTLNNTDFSSYVCYVTGYSGRCVFWFFIFIYLCEPAFWGWNLACISVTFCMNSVSNPSISVTLVLFGRFIRTRYRW